MKKFLVNLVWFIADLLAGFEQPVTESPMTRVLEDVNKE